MILIQKFLRPKVWECGYGKPWIWVYLGGSRRDGIGQGRTQPHTPAIPIQGVSTVNLKKELTPMQEVVHYGMVGLNIALPGATFLVLLICSLKGY